MQHSCNFNLIGVLCYDTKDRATNFAWVANPHPPPPSAPPPSRITLLIRDCILINNNGSLDWLKDHRRTLLGDDFFVLKLNPKTWFVKLRVNINRITGPTVVQRGLASRHFLSRQKKTTPAFLYQERFPSDPGMATNQSATTEACVDQVPVVECTKIILIRHQVCYLFPNQPIWCEFLFLFCVKGGTLRAAECRWTRTMRRHMQKMSWTRLQGIDYWQRFP